MFGQCKVQIRKVLSRHTSRQQKACVSNVPDKSSVVCLFSKESAPAVQKEVYLALADVLKPDYQQLISNILSKACRHQIKL